MGETKTQKEFKRAIKELEKDGYTFKNPRTRTVRFEDKKSTLGRYSIGGAILILWNIFAISTWILPRFGIYPMQYFQQPSVFTNQIPGITSPINTPQKNVTIGSNTIDADTATRFEEYIDVTARVEKMAYKIITDLVNMIQSNNHDVAKLLDMT